MPRNSNGKVEKAPF